MLQRQTKQKEIIYAALCRLADHPTADSVYGEVHKEHPSISRATVYRVLNQMAENGTALKISLADGADRFDHSPTPHCHARCVNCRKLFDLPFVQLNLGTILPEGTENFDVTGYSLLFEGLCSQCRKAAESEK